MRWSALLRLTRKVLFSSIPGVSALALAFVALAHGYVQLSADDAAQSAETPALESAQTVAENASGQLIADLRSAARRRVALAEETRPEAPVSPAEAAATPVAAAPAATAESPSAAGPATASTVANLPPLRGKLEERAAPATLAEVEAPQPPRRPANLKFAAPAAPAKPDPAQVAAPAQPVAPAAAPAQTAAPAQPPQAAPAQVAEAPAAPTQPRGRGRRGRSEVATAPVDNRNFIERLFGLSASQSQANQGGRQALAYAAPEAGGTTSILRSLSAAPRMGAEPGYDQFTAIYDISARTVFLPDGTRLEAHSGLGSRLDNPAHVHERMVGPTPPALYALSPREALFHGVAALRLTPLSGQTFGRSGLLAHTFMLGPNGDSNGCVSFRDYGAFLRAFQSGQVRKLMVVAHR